MSLEPQRPDEVPAAAGAAGDGSVARPAADEAAGSGPSAAPADARDAVAAPGLAPGEPPPPSAAPAGVAGAVVLPASHRCAFTGRAADYFRIWIVNLLLTLVTLGLWSPWAKVRKLRYFHGHTWVADANFEYHGNPFAILRGRLLAVTAFGAYWVVDHLRPGAGPWLLLLLIAAAPWIIARSLAFNATNTSHRGIRFGFDCRVLTVAAAIWPLALWPFVLMFSQNPQAVADKGMFYGALAGIAAVVLAGAYPYAMARVRRLTVEHARWGQTRFLSTLRSRSVYAIYGIASLLGLACGVVLGLAGYALSMLAFSAAGEHAGTTMAIGFGAFWLAYGLVVSVVLGYTRSRITNLTFNTAWLGDLARFRSTVSARALTRMYAGNLLLILLSGGLLIPWAVIRVARYRVESLTVVVAGALDEVTAAVTSGAGATGQELGEIFGFDLAL